MPIHSVDEAMRLAASVPPKWHNNEWQRNEQARNLEAALRLALVTMCQLRSDTESKGAEIDEAVWRSWALEGLYDGLNIAQSVSASPVQAINPDEGHRSDYGWLVHIEDLLLKVVKRRPRLDEHNAWRARHGTCAVRRFGQQVIREIEDGVLKAYAHTLTARAEVRQAPIRLGCAKTALALCDFGLLVRFATSDSSDQFVKNCYRTPLTSETKDRLSVIFEPLEQALIKVQPVLS